MVSEVENTEVRYFLSVFGIFGNCNTDVGIGIALKVAVTATVRWGYRAALYPDITKIFRLQGVFRTHETNRPQFSTSLQSTAHVIL